MNKWSLGVQSASDRNVEYKSMSYFVTANLLYQISSQATSKFVLHSQSLTQASTSLVLYLWVFAPRLTASVADLCAQDQGPLLITKIFYKLISERDMIALLDEGNLSSSSTEAIIYEQNIISEIHRMLEASTKTLPQSTRKFKQFNVGYLERYTSS